MPDHGAEGLPPDLGIEPPAALRIGGKIVEEGGWQSYLAWDKRKHGDVALIVPQAERRHDRIFVGERLARAEATLRLRHPGIVSVFDTGDADNPYIVEEIVEGPSLKDVLDDQGWLEPRDALAIAAQIARALDFAHARKQTHGQLGLSDILIDERTGRVKLQGFASSPAGEDWNGIRAPEVLAGSDVDGRADLFTLGALLYRSLSARPAFTARDPQGLARAIIEKDPRPLSELRPVLPVEVVRIVERLLSKDRRSRYQTGNALAETIERMLPTLPELKDEPPNLLPDAYEAVQGRNRRTSTGVFAATTIAMLVAGGLYYAYGPGGRTDKGREDRDRLPNPSITAIPSIPEIVSRPREATSGDGSPDDQGALAGATPTPADAAWLAVAREVNRLGCARAETEPGWFEREIVVRFGRSSSEIDLARQIGTLSDASEARIWKVEADTETCALLDLLGTATTVADRRLIQLLPHRDNYAYSAKEWLAIEAQTPRGNLQMRVDRIDASGRVTRIWPEDGTSRSPGKGETIRIGGGETAGLLEVAAPYGTELLVLLASPRPLAIDEDTNSGPVGIDVYRERLEQAFEKAGADADIISSVLIFETVEGSSSR
ncbi:MAG: protein kinase [Geminicoccaceae bacterium]